MTGYTPYASFDATGAAFRAHITPERINFYTGATGDRFCCALPSAELLAAESPGFLKVGRLVLFGWQVSGLKDQLAARYRLQARRGRLSGLAGSD